MNTKKLAAELSKVGARSALLHTAEGREVVSAALASHHAQLTLQAANLIAEHKPSGFERALAEAYRALSAERASALDPGCIAKAALVAALDAVEDVDTELFVSAARYFQHERVKGVQRDTAASVRARGVLGVARLGHTDALPIFGACLGDHDSSVRFSAARAIAHRESRDGAGLLLLRLGAGEDTQDVAMECVRALFAVAPDLGIQYARAALQTGEREVREPMLQLLGTAADDRAIELLADELASQSLAAERRLVIQAVGLSLRPSARTLLLELVVSERPSDAEAALAALAIHRYDDRLVARVRELTDHSRELAQLYREHFLS